MNNELQVFNFKENNVRTTMIKGNPYFCLKDVCGILDIKNHKEVVSRLNTKGVDTADLLTNGGIQNATFINESNLYKVIFQSRKEEAEQFQDWVTSDVLPTIRKTGEYNQNLPTTYKEALQHLLMQVEENEKLQIANSEMKPKAQYFDCIVDRNLLLNFRDTAKELHLGQKELIKFMVTNKYLYRDASGALKPYMNYVDNGLFELKEFVSKSNHAGNQTLITPKGRETFRMLLKVMS